MTRTIISTKDAPAAVGPYSQGVRVGNFVYTAGQIPLDPATGQLVEGGIEAQTERVLRNLQAVLEAAGSSLDQVVKTTVFLTDMADFQALNGVYGRFFSPDQAPPARSTVAVAALPLGVRVEIEAVALVGGR
jgi:2-iminobutanoate/2-iminopropanoate deaminase